MDLREQLQRTLGDAYTLERELGGGGMSRVFVAEETRLKRKVVVKVLSPELAQGLSVSRFEREIQTAAALQQANIVPVLTAGDTNGLPFYTMPLVEGESLRSRLGRGPLAIAEAVGVLRDVAKAIAYAHSRGVVHRDIKPDNVLLSGGTAVVTDFGIAKAISAARAEPGGATLTQVGTSIGTPAYMSPEQAAGDPNVDHRADIYSLGCMAYELLAGQAPFSGRTPQRTLAAHVSESPKSVAEFRADTPAPLVELVMACLAKEPNDRPQSAADVVRSLDTITSGSGMPAMAIGGAATFRKALAIYGGAFVAVAILAQAAIVGIGLPDWVLPGTLIVMALGLPVILFTGYVHWETRKALMATPAYTPGGTSFVERGAVASLAIKASPHFTWRRTFRGTAFTLGAFAVMIAAIMILRVFGIGPAASLLAAGKLHGRERVLVTDFRAGSDSSLSHLVTEAVRTNLSQSSVISIMPPTAIAAAWQRMQRPPASNLSLSLAREIAQREGVKAIVDGDVTPLGTGYVVTIRLVAADSGEELAAYRKTVDGPSGLLGAIDAVTKKLRGRIGESLKTVRDAPRLEEVTTPSLEALRKYAEGARASDLEGDYARAATLLREAVAKDTLFAMAYRKLGIALSNAGMPFQQRDSALTRAYQYRDRLTERERYLAIGSYYQTGPGRDRVKAAEAFQRVIALDPADIAASNNLANLLRSRRQFARAESLYRGVTTNDRVTQTSLGNLGGVLFDEGKLAEAESVTDRIRKQFPSAPLSFALPTIFLYARGQLDSLDAYLRPHLSDQNPLVRVSANGNLALLAVLRGRLRDARALSEEARKLNVARGVPDNPYAEPTARASTQIWFLEQREKGVLDLDAALAKTPLRSVPVEQRPYLGFAALYALAGRADRARAMIAQFDADVRDTAMRTVQMPSRHNALGEIALAEHKPLDAVREFWRSDSLPDGPASACATCVYADLGRAFDLANMPDSAMGYWERYIARPFAGKLGRDASVLAGIHKRLGELYEAKGNVANALAHYQKFVDLWKSADPELQPKVNAARQRIAKLKSVERKKL